MICKIIRSYENFFVNVVFCVPRVLPHQYVLRLKEKQTVRSQCRSFRFTSNGMHNKHLTVAKTLSQNDPITVETYPMEAGIKIRVARFKFGGNWILTLSEPLEGGKGKMTLLPLKPLLLLLLDW